MGLVDLAFLSTSWISLQVVLNVVVFFYKFVFFVTVQGLVFDGVRGEGGSIIDIDVLLACCPN